MLYDTLMSLTQEAEQADKAHIVENGTHVEETNANGNLDDSLVMPPLLSFPPLHALCRFTVSHLFLSIQYNQTISLLSIPFNLIRLLICSSPLCPSHHIN